MKRQRRRDTRPELLVRALLRELGLHYRIANHDLPGSPDVANRRHRWAIFVHGCYWHHHEGCARATVPARNREFWVRKFEDNRERDARKEAALRDLGFSVVVVWECETRNFAALRDRLATELKSRRLGAEG